MWPQSGSKEGSVSSKRWFADELRLCIVSLSLSLSFWKVAILHFTSLSWLFLIFGFFLSCVICTFTFLYIVFFSSWQPFPSHSFGAKFTNRTENIWMEKYLDEYLDGPRCWWCCGPQPVSCPRKPPSILMDKTLGTSLLIAQLSLASLVHADVFICQLF